MARPKKAPSHPMATVFDNFMGARMAATVSGNAMPEWPVGSMLLFGEQQDAPDWRFGCAYLIALRDDPQMIVREVQPGPLDSLRLHARHPDQGQYPDLIVDPSEIAWAAIYLMRSVTHCILPEDEAAARAIANRPPPKIDLQAERLRYLFGT